MKSETNLILIRARDCLACGKAGPSDPDHIRTKGSGGGDEITNLMPLCRKCHSEKHAQGLRTFVKKYALPISWSEGYPKRILSPYET